MVSAAILIAIIVGLVFGIVAVVEAQGRNWAGWGVIAITIALLIWRLG
jgi:uncharacterized membrane protein (DUF441 family)